MTSDIGAACMMLLTLPFVYLRYYLFLDRLRFRKSLIIAGIALIMAICIGYFLFFHHYNSARITVGMNIATFVYSLLVIRATLRDQLFIYALVACYGQLLYSLAVTIDDLIVPMIPLYIVSSPILFLGLLLTYPKMLHFFRCHVAVILRQSPPWLIWVATASMLLGFWGALLLYYPFSQARTFTLFLFRLFILIICMICAYMSVYLYSILQRQQEVTGNLRMARWIHDSEKQFYHLLMHFWQETRRQRHDVRHHVRALRQMVSDRRYNKITAYIQPLSMQVDKISDEKQLLEQLLDYWFQQAREGGCIIERNLPGLEYCASQPEQVVLLNGVLQYTVQGALASGREHPAITFYTKLEGNFLMLYSSFHCDAGKARMYSEDIQLWSQHCQQMQNYEYAKTMQGFYDGTVFHFSMLLGKINGTAL